MSRIYEGRLDPDGVLQHRKHLQGGSEEAPTRFDAAYGVREDMSRVLADSRAGDGGAPSSALGAAVGDFKVVSLGTPHVASGDVPSHVHARVSVALGALRSAHARRDLSR